MADVKVNSNDKSLRRNIFCKVCQALLTKVTTPDRFFFVCEACNTQTDINALDTLVSQTDKKKQSTTFPQYIKNVREDPAARRVPIDCECGSDIAIQIRDPDELSAVIVCMKCQKIYYKDSGLANIEI